MIGRFAIGSQVRAGDDVEMRVDTRRLHFFDLETEAAIDVAPEDSAAGRATARLEA